MDSETEYSAPRSDLALLGVRIVCDADNWAEGSVEPHDLLVVCSRIEMLLGEGVVVLIKQVHGG